MLGYIQGNACLFVIVSLVSSNRYTSYCNAFSPVLNAVSSRSHPFVTSKKKMNDNSKAVEECSSKNGKSSVCYNSGSALYMGRAAAVRAATKTKTDGRKAKTNAAFGKKIIMAVKNGGSADPVANRSLADVIKQAKTNNVPTENISRAIKKASEPNTSAFAESLYEAYGFGGASFIIHVLTDNPNRSNADVRIAVNKNDGKMAEQGSVAFMYDRKGKVTVVGEVDEDTLLEAAMEAGCDDLEIVEGEDDDGTTIVYTNPSELALMNEALSSIEKEVTKSELVYVSKALIECSEEDFEKNMVIIDALDEVDDVDFVEHNMCN